MAKCKECKMDFVSFSVLDNTVFLVYRCNKCDRSVHKTFLLFSETDFVDKEITAQRYYNRDNK